METSYCDPIPTINAVSISKHNHQHQMMSILKMFNNIILLLSRVIIMLALEVYSKLFGAVVDIPSDSINDNVINSRDITEIVANYGYIIREHVVTTRDDYILLLHKLEKPNSRYNGNGKIVYFHHGLCTNSELFVLGSEFNKNLPYLLLEKGWEVWLGNNRGNKYSRKHLKVSVSSKQYWDFSLDEFALYDIPDSIAYIKLQYLYRDKITYIGFSQGCAQLFASLSLHSQQLHSSLNLFVGLSPPIIPNKYTKTGGWLLTKIIEMSASDNQFMYSLFGRRAMLPSVSFWVNLLPYKFFASMVDYSLVLLFNWKTKNISPEQKRVGYRHMYSVTSVKSVMHWFQIIYSNRFQMFHETCSVGRSFLSTWIGADANYPGYRAPPFPIAHHLDLTMLLVYGDKDNLIDIELSKELILDQNQRMKDKLYLLECPGYEHMDTLWSDTVYEDVFVKILDAMEGNFPKHGYPNGTVKIMKGALRVK